MSSSEEEEETSSLPDIEEEFTPLTRSTPEDGVIPETPLEDLNGTCIVDILGVELEEEAEEGAAAVVVEGSAPDLGHYR